ncbi:type II toxin-antitoxin system VapB family antitoxin [Streptomyces sp. NPDC050439]|uniref:type II toxin-antitoxin system VapB family antitoxin n=1 Tax=unclassified Streptomyces TaxID=2593676 RepID=UPI00342A083C
MTKMLIDIDDEALAEAQKILGTATKKDTVNQALADIRQRSVRAQARRELAQLVASGAIDLDALNEKHGYDSYEDLREPADKDQPTAE